MRLRTAALPAILLGLGGQLGCPGDPPRPDDDVADDDGDDDDSHGLLGLESSPDVDDSGLGPALAWAGVLEEGSDLLVGGAAGASRPGDYIVVNNMGRFVVRGDRQGSGYVGVPGALIDIDCRRIEGNADADALVELVTLLGEGRVFVATSFEVETEGLEPGVSAQLKLHGTDVPLDLLTASLEDPGAYPPLGLEVHQSLTLAPGSPAMWLETTVVNTTDQHLNLPVSDLMFVDASVAAPFVPGIGFGGEGATGERDIVAYQSHDSEQAIGLFSRDDSVRIDHLPGVHDAIGHVVAEGPTLSLAPGEYDSYRRVVAAVRDVGTMDFYRKLTGETWPVTLEGWIRYVGEAGRIWHARVFLQDPDGTPWLMARTESLGGYYLATDEGDWRVDVVADLDNEWVDLPPGAGAFGARANEADNEQALWAWTNPEAVVVQPVADGHHRPGEASITLEPGRTWLEFDLVRPATLAIRVEDGDGQPLPAVVQVRFPPGGSDPHPPRTELGESRPGDGLRKVLFLVDGEAEVPVPAGTYDLLAHRGLQYEIDRSEDVVLVSQETTSVTLTLDRAFDTGAFVAADLHSHASASPDGEATAQERLAVAAANGIQVHVATEADQVADYRSVVTAMGLDGTLMSVPGVELSSLAHGRYVAYPLEPDESLPNGGAVRWWEGSIQAEELTDRLRQSVGASAVIQVHDGRGDRGMFALAGYDPDTGQSTTPSRYGGDFDAVELVTGAWSADTEQLRVDWCSLLDRGERPVAVGASGATGRAPDASLARTYLDAGGGDVGGLDPEDIASAVRGGRTVVSAGPYIELRATDGAGGEAGPGGSLSAASATLHVRVLAPSWMDVDSVEVVGPGCSAVASHTVEPGASAPVWFEGEIPVQPDGDAYYFVEVRGTDPMDPVWPDAIPYAITNPVFIDAP